MRIPADGTYRARWVVPVVNAPIDGGYVTFQDGVVVYCGKHCPAGPACDLGDVALLPGLINAHTHLEFSDCETPLGEAGMELVRWIEQVIMYRQQHGIDDQQRRANIQRGLQESRHAGVVCLGEIASCPAKPPQLLGLQDPDLVFFTEVLGMSAGRRLQTVEWSEGVREELRASKSGQYRVGLSPHAPYSTPLSLVQEMALVSSTQGLPLAMHVAESSPELQWMETGDGAFRQLFERLGMDVPFESLELYSLLGLLEVLSQASSCLVVHGNYLGVQEIEFLAGQPQMSVVYCPRTHAYFEHPKHPVEQLLEKGVRVILGTDSRASNPDLSVWREGCFIRQLLGGIAPQQILSMMTRDSADALGQQRYGHLMAGATGGMVCIANHASTEKQLWESLFSVPAVKSEQDFLDSL